MIIVANTMLSRRVTLALFVPSRFIIWSTKAGEKYARSLDKGQAISAPYGSWYGRCSEIRP